MEFVFNETAADVMKSRDLCVINATGNTYGSIANLLNTTGQCLLSLFFSLSLLSLPFSFCAPPHSLSSPEFSGYPIVKSMDSMQLIGYISRANLETVLNAKTPDMTDATQCFFTNDRPFPRNAPYLDFNPWLDQSPIQVRRRERREDEDGRRGERKWRGGRCQCMEWEERGEQRSREGRGAGRIEGYLWNLRCQGLKFLVSSADIPIPSCLTDLPNFSSPQIVETTPLNRVIDAFRALRLRYVLVVRNGALVGITTKVRRRRRSPLTRLIPPGCSETSCAGFILSGGRTSSPAST